MKAKIYYLVRRIFSQATRNKLKTLRYDLKKRIAPIKLKTYGRFSADELQRELLAKLPGDFDVLVVHSSHSNLLPMYEGDLSDLLQVVLAIAADRTLVMPAFFFGHRRFNYDVLKYYQENPYFDADSTPSQMGMISELFRKFPGVKCSCHPTHRISALGPLAEMLVSEHYLSQTGCGKGSPFDKMTKLKTIVLGIGTKYYQCMTQTHSAEDMLIETGRYPTQFKLSHIPITLKYSRDQEKEYTLTWPDKSPYRRVLHPFLRNMLNKTEMYEWKFYGVPFFYANAARVQEVLIKAALNGRSVYQ